MNRLVRLVNEPNEPNEPMPFRVCCTPIKRRTHHTLKRPNHRPLPQPAKNLLQPAKKNERIEA